MLLNCLVHHYQKGNLEFILNRATRLILRKWLLIYPGVTVEVLRSAGLYTISPTRLLQNFLSNLICPSLIPLHSHWTPCSSSDMGTISSLWHWLCLFSLLGMPLRQRRVSLVPSLSKILNQILPFQGDHSWPTDLKFQPFPILIFLSSCFIIFYFILFIKL